VKRALNRATSSPAKPIKGATPGTSIAHNPNSVFAEMLLDAIGHRVAFKSTEATPEELHDSRIGIHHGKRFPILITPSTQADAAAG
jgi:hypothetical protein